jgi:uncharacterized protein (TIGR02391 family)
VAGLDNTARLKLEALFDMGGGYVLDLTNATFASFVRTSIGFDPYEKYGDELSKAKLLRAIWEGESAADVAKLNLDLLEHWRVTKLLTGSEPTPSEETLRQELVDFFAPMAAVAGSVQQEIGAPVAFTTEASVTANKIQIEIHEDIYNHIGQYLATGDYFHAVEESYKLVREKLREITGKEKASDVFTNSAQSDAHYKALFGKAKPSTAAEADFFRGIGYLHLGVQHLRNEKAHTPATPMEPNLAIHYVSLASLAYDLITRYVSEETISEIEEIVLAKRRAYRSASAFYRDFENGRWLQSIDLPVNLESSSVRKVLKKKWLEDADFTRSYDHSNVVLMQLELVAVELTKGDIDRLLELPTVDSYGNDQEAGMLPFLEYIEQQYPGKLSARAKRWMKERASA